MQAYASFRWSVPLPRQVLGSSMRLPNPTNRTGQGVTETAIDRPPVLRCFFFLPYARSVGIADIIPYENSEWSSAVINLHVAKARM